MERSSYGLGLGAWLSYGFVDVRRPGKNHDTDGLPVNRRDGSIGRIVKVNYSLKCGVDETPNLTLMRGGGDKDYKLTFGSEIWS